MGVCVYGSMGMDVCVYGCIDDNQAQLNKCSSCKSTVYSTESVLHIQVCFI